MALPLAVGASSAGLSASRLFLQVEHQEQQGALGFGLAKPSVKGKQGFALG
jgi:hypothetical protein